MIKQILFVTSILISTSIIAQVEIYNEDFETGIPVDYTIIDNDGNTPNPAVSEFTDAWIRLADPDNPTDTVMGSTSYFDPAGQADRWLITPAITLGPWGNRLYWEAKSHDASFPDDYLVLVSTSDTQLSSFTDTVGYIIEEYEQWVSREVDLAALGYDGMTVYFAFVNRTNDGFKLYIDDIRVEKENDLATNELSDFSYNVYPNPTSDIIHVNTTDLTKLSIHDLRGKQLAQTENSEINISNLSNGIYLLIIETKTGKTSCKIVKR